LFDLHLQGIGLANHATYFDVILHYFAIEFKSTHQVFLVVDNVHSQVAASLQQSFLFSFYKYDINHSFYLFINNKCFFCDLFSVVPFGLNLIIKFINLIGYSQVNDPSIKFFLLLSKHNRPAT
jgi:hypothetical protein